MDDYETVLLIKHEVFVFKIPPRATNRGYRAADWKLDAPDWTGRMKVVCKGKKCIIKLEDKTTGELFAESPIDKYPGIAVEAVMDSSRYFVLRIEDVNGRAAFIGIGFADRGDSFDLNVALQEHFKWLEKSEEIEKGLDASEGKPNLDLGFKEGQTITINMNIGKKSGSSKPRPKTSSLAGVPGLLPPPPGGIKLPPPSSSKPTISQSSMPSVKMPQTAASNVSSSSDLLLDLGTPATDGDLVQNTSNSSQQNSGADLWGEFTTASASSSASGKTEVSTENWMNF
ncbi:NECAP-like protein CG9132 [Uloborus diversus]|uniref:NECAP-like protein CG9132 n=1 Tax=Uloborus diversus TaxID=327109 RepID=UPI00240A46FB|nr:NECAP-like protein CG9132 [Uloborus diversus]